MRILQDADHIFISLLHEWGLYDKVWQALTVLLPVRSVGIMGDERTYENAVVLRAVTSTDAMTAEWSPLPYDFLAKVSNDIINKVKGVNRVTYDISSKPLLPLNGNKHQGFILIRPPLPLPVIVILGYPR